MTVTATGMPCIGRGWPGRCDDGEPAVACGSAAGRRSPRPGHCRWTTPGTGPRHARTVAAEVRLPSPDCRRQEMLSEPVPASSRFALPVPGLVVQHTAAAHWMRARCAAGPPNAEPDLGGELTRGSAVPSSRRIRTCPPVSPGRVHQPRSGFRRDPRGAGRELPRGGAGPGARRDPAVGAGGTGVAPSHHHAPRSGEW